MDVEEALEKARRIVIEEEAQPTLGYVYVSAQWPRSKFYQQVNLQNAGYTAGMAAQMGLQDERKVRPRYVYEDPRLFVFRSTNFDLLIKIFSQVADNDRSLFVDRILTLVRRPIGAKDKTGVQTVFPSFDGKISALALIAEFSIRTGYLKEFLAATAAPVLPTPSLAIMLMEMEEMIAHNFNLFSDTDLVAVPKGLANLREIAERQTYSAQGWRGEPVVENPHYKQGYQDIGKDIVTIIDAITEECRKARYFYLKGALQELPNLEIESDKLKVEEYLVKLGFTGEMVKALNAAESDYKSTATPFELKNCLGHLRSFLEHLHRRSAKAIADAAGDPLNDRWGDATLYLRNGGYLTKQHEAFIASLYTLISDNSVHPLGADREYARLLRNVVIEYGVMFLSVLDKKGIRIPALSSQISTGTTP
jgi:hypothetical protein